MFNRITPWLYQGMQPTVKRYQDLKDVGITHVLTVNYENPSVRDAERIFGAANVLYLPWLDDFASKPIRDFVKLDTWMWMLPKKYVIYTHCSAGINRSTVANIFLLMREGMSGNDAFELILRGRPSAMGWTVKAYRESLLLAQQNVLMRDIHGKPLLSNREIPDGSRA